jgi:hypothetical protein
MLGATGFLNDFVKDEVKCRGLSVEDFGAEIDNEKNDIPLYDMYNRGLAVCEEGMERKNLQLEGKRPGLTGYIPSMEEGMENQWKNVLTAFVRCLLPQQWITIYTSSIQ